MSPARPGRMTAVKLLTCHRLGRCPPLFDTAITAVQLPQELIDAIIDEFDISLTDDDGAIFTDRQTLMSCALVARAFVRPSQANLFSTVNLHAHKYYGNSPDERSRLFATLLSSRPHIGQYVRTMILSYQRARLNSVDHILASLPNVEVLSLHPWFNYEADTNPPFPIQLRNSIVALLATAPLRRLELRDHQFETWQDLQHMLSNSLGLKELMLSDIDFADITRRPSELHPEPPRIVLRSFEVFRMATDVVEAMLNTCTIVDITHLRSLSCDRYHTPLLQANAHSIQELTCVVGDWLDERYADELVQILPATTTLLRLNLRVETHYHLPLTILRLGNLTGLDALKGISVSARIGHVDQMLSEVDPQLAGIGSQLEEIHMGFLHYQHEYEDLYRRAMPILDAKGILSISSIFPASEPKQFS
ncbi:hypothetical protein DFH09DRAFT_1146758 [Mycena vulgaris]|nr:hypothetical protein DFH09DRAFT_1146758 [Mycena vulgaris]